MKKTIGILTPPLLILLYVYAAVSKLADTAQFRGELYNQVFSPATAELLFFLLPASELVTAALLFFERTRTSGLLLSLILLTFFTGYIALTLAGFWHTVPCSCGGVLSQLGWKEHLIFNITFLSLNIAALYAER